MTDVDQNESNGVVEEEFCSFQSSLSSPFGEEWREQDQVNT